MGYSLSQEQFERLEANRRAGRQCAMATGRGGCFTRATWKETHESWPYAIGEGESKVSEMVFCGAHHNPEGYRGVNFVVRSVEKLPRMVKA